VGWGREISAKFSILSYNFSLSSLYLQPSEVYDEDWLIARMTVHYADISMVPMLAKGAMTLLTSTKSNEELQTEVSGPNTHNNA